MNEYYNEACDLFNEIENYIYSIEYKGDKSTYVGGMLFSRIFEGLLNSMIGLRYNTISSAQNNMRNAFEGLVDLSNLVDDENYYYVLILSCIDQEKKMFNTIKEKEAHSKESNDRYSVAKIEYKKVKELIIEKYDKNFKFPSFKYKMSKFRDFKDGPLFYNELCRHTHNNIDTLFKYNSDKFEENKKLYYRKRIPENEVKKLLCYIMIHASEALGLMSELNTILDEEQGQEIVNKIDTYLEKILQSNTIN